MAYKEGQGEAESEEAREQEQVDGAWFFDAEEAKGGDLDERGGDQTNGGEEAMEPGAGVEGGKAER